MSSVYGWLLTALLWLYYLSAVVAHLPEIPWVLAMLQLGSGLVGVVAVLLRHRFPALAVVVAAATLLVSPAALGAALFCQASVARHQARRWAIASAAWIVLAKVLGLLFGPESSPWSSASSFELTVAIAGTALVTVVAWLLDSLAAESRSVSAAELARHEADQARLEQARLAERDRIAREMHDALAHRLSLVALHAGALAYRTDLDSATARDTAALIQANARQSLADLRTVLGTLRDADAGPEPPQPTLTELPVLFAEAEDAGQRIDRRVGELGDVGDHVSRQAYRIIQEALTNARKHAPGAPVTVRVDRGPDDVRIRVSNPVADLVPAGRTTPGYGLVGVAERVSSVGGTEHHGVVDRRFLLEVSLPVRSDR